MGNDKPDFAYSPVYTDFNPRSRVGNDLLYFRLGVRYHNFNPRSRVGNDLRIVDSLTFPSNFNPRSRVGNDVMRLLPVSVVATFQSTFPRGERHKYTDADGVDIGISIHVPAWGTTDIDFSKRIIHVNFNPRSRVGNDGRLRLHCKVIVNFNPRSRVGNDPFQAVFSIPCTNFNPRSRVGNDFLLLFYFKLFN